MNEQGIRRSRRVVPRKPLLLPGLAELGGANDSDWHSDIVVLSPHEEPGITAFELFPRSDSPDGRAELSIDLQATRLQRFERLPWTLFGFRGAASLRVQSWGQAIALNGRTFHQNGRGSYGQAIPSFAAQDAVVCGESASLVGLQHSDDPSSGFRSNLGLVNPGSETALTQVDLLAPDGVLLRRIERELRPNESIQINDVLTGLPLTEVAAAEVSCSTAAGSVVAYASVIDNRSHDPRLVAPARVAHLGSVLLVPCAAHSEGVGSSRWKTDLALHALSDGPARGRVEVIPWGGNAAAVQLPVKLAAGGSILLEDVVGTAGLSGGATLRVVADEGAIAAEGRCFTEGAAGSYGQRLPALSPREDAILTGQVGLLAGLAQLPTRVRTNLGLVNLAATDTEVGLTLRGVAGEELGSTTVHLPAHASGQWNRIVGSLAGGNVELAWLQIRPLDADASVLAYASIIDDRTHDPVLVVATPEVSAVN